MALIVLGINHHSAPVDVREKLAFPPDAQAAALTDLVRQRGRTVVVVLHDLNLACRYADHIVAMKSGSIVAEGRPVDVITESVIADVFGMASRVVVDPVSNTPMVVPIGRHYASNRPEPVA